MKKILYRLLIIAILFFGCDKDILNLEDPNNYTEDTYFTSQEECLQAVNAIYGSFYFVGLFARDWYFIFDLAGNEAKPGLALGYTGMTAFANYCFNASEGNLNGLWRSLYRIILRSNLVFEKVGIIIMYNRFSRLL